MRSEAPRLSARREPDSKSHDSPMNWLTIANPKRPTVAWAVLLAAPVAVSLACGTARETPADLPAVKPSFETSTLAQEPVPQSLTEALDTLDRASSGALLLKMRNGEEEVSGELHDGLGLWIRNNWSLYDKGALYQDLARQGLRYPDDMSNLVLKSWWRRMHGRPLDVSGQVKAIQETNRILAAPPAAPAPPRIQRERRGAG